MNINEKLFRTLAEKKRLAALAAVKSGANINGETDMGERVWSFTVPAGNEAVKLALELGADVNLLDAAGNNALYWAVQADDPEVAKTLLSKGASMERPSASDEYNLLHDAAAAGYANVLSVMVTSAPDRLLHAKNILGRTPLDEAIEGHHKDCIDVFKLRK